MMYATDYIKVPVILSNNKSQIFLYHIIVVLDKIQISSIVYIYFIYNLIKSNNLSLPDRKKQLEYSTNSSFWCILEYILYTLIKEVR